MRQRGNAQYMPIAIPGRVVNTCAARFQGEKGHTEERGQRFRWGSASTGNGGASSNRPRPSLQSRPNCSRQKSPALLCPGRDPRKGSRKAPT